jgi:large subunit ribosomal protein L24
MKIKKKDMVLITAGRDRGKKGRVLKVLSEKNRVMVEGINLVKKKIRPRREGEKGQVVEVAQPLSVSNVSLICPQCGERTKVGYRGEGAKEKKRICRKCEKIID